jgi:hypothetical protein
MYINTTTIALAIALESELGCYGQSYSDCIDRQVLTVLNSVAIVRVIVIVLIYTF